MSRVAVARWVLILGLVFVFLWFGVDKFVHPKTWIGWMPDWMDGLLGKKNDVWLHIVGMTEIMIALAFLTPVRMLKQIASIAASLHLLAILSQIGWNDVAVRDIGLLFMSISVWFLV